MRLHPAQKALRKYASPSRAKAAGRFFKTGPGEYGEGDVFIGCTVPNTRSIVRQFRGIDLTEIGRILSSKIHEDRLLALLMLVDAYQSAKSDLAKSRIAALYLKKRSFVNNWDLVDTSAYKILGQHCLDFENVAPLEQLARSRRHWDRRMAMVASYAFIRTEKLDLTYQFAKQLLNDPEDLMHKASGWMLREAGKRDQDSLRAFIDQHGSAMPRTMLRYAIERFSAVERRRILLKTKSDQNS
jgi:3-methyladenine DNA glycosylase AlkD